MKRSIDTAPYRLDAGIRLLIRGEIGYKVTPVTCRFVRKCRVAARVSRGEANRRFTDWHTDVCSMATCRNFV